MGMVSKLRLLVVGAAFAARCSNAAAPGIFEIRAATATPTQTATAYSLYYRDGRNERLLVEPEVLLDHRAIKTARRERGSDGSSQIRLTLSKEGESKFREVTQKFQNRRLAIFLDGWLESAPTVGQSTDGDTVIVSEKFSEEEANDLVNKLNAIASMFELRAVTDKPTRTSEAYSLPAREGKSEQIFVEPDVLLDWSSVRWVGLGSGLEESKIAMWLSLWKDGTKKFGEITKRYQGKRVAVFLDGHLQSAPQVQQLRGIRGDDTVVITGDFSDHFIGRLNSLVISPPLPAEFEPVRDFSQYKTGDQLWQLLEKQLEFEKHLHPGEGWTTKEVRVSRDRQYAIVSELLKRFPDDSHKWEANKIKAETTRTSEGADITKELSKASGVPADIKKWARFEYLDHYYVGKGQSGEAEIADYCRDYPGDVSGCESLKLNAAWWYVAFRKEPDKAAALLKDLIEHGVEGTRKQANDLLRKQQELLTTEGRARYGREEVASLERMSGLAQLRGKPLNLKTQGIDGAEIDAEKLRGKVILLDFWATWCGPCVQDIPNLTALYDKYHEKGFEIIGLSHDADAEVVRKFSASKRMPWPECLHKGDVLPSFNPPGIPAAVLVNRKGNVVSLCRYPYTDNDAEWHKMREADIEKLLAE
jgi:thiol-disulfide isomerase/thioredoxin